MNSTIIATYLALSAIACQGGNAQPLPQEPLQIYGIPAGKPIDLPQCEGPSFRPSNEKNTCQYKPSYGDAEIGLASNNCPDFIQGCQLKANLNGSKEVIGFEIHTRGMIYRADALAALQKKFGKPKTIVQRESQNRYGARISSKIFGWNFPNAEITFFEMIGEPDVGIIVIKTPELLERENAEKKKTAPM